MTNFFSIFLDIFLLLINVFFFNRIAIILVSYIDSIKRKKLWATVFVVFIDLAMLWVYAGDYLWYEISNQGKQYKTADLVNIILRAVVILFMLYTTVTSIIGVFKIKSRRQREFERQMQGKEKNYLAQIIIASIALVAGIIGLIYYKINYISDYKTDINICIIIIVIAVLLLAYSIYMTIMTKKKATSAPVTDGYVNFKEATTQKERTCVFIIEDDENHYMYKTSYKGRIALNELVGQIADYYYISNYGILKGKDEEYDLFGVKTSSFDTSLLSQINMVSFHSEEVESILPYLEKNHSKIFRLDEFGNPINSFDA